MNKHFRSILCSLLAVILLVGLLPMTAAAANPKIEAYKAYAEFLNTRTFEIGKPIWGNDFYNEFYNLVISSNRDGKLQSVEEITFEDVTSDGIKDLFVTLEVDYDNGRKSQSLSYIYTYENGSLKEIGCFHTGQKPTDTGGYTTLYPANFIWSFGEVYHSVGPDGKTYLCTVNPNGYDFFSIPCYFYGYDGTQMVQVGEFRETFIPDWEIGNIQSEYGKYHYSYNDETVSKAVYENALNKLRSGGSHKIEYMTLKDATNWLNTEISNPFTDVANSDWFVKPVMWAVDNNITGGIGNGMFGPNNPCTRAQVVTFLWAANGKPEPSSSNNPFTDVANDAWYLKPVLWAVERGITGGTSPTTFSPDAECTRAQIVTFLYAAAGKPSISGVNLFLDVNESDWYFPPILWAKENEITGGTSNTTFSPLDVCTRGQVVTFLYKAYFGNIIKPEIKPDVDPSRPLTRIEQVSPAQSYTNANGPSVAQALWSLSDGSYQTADGRLTAAPGEAMVIRNGEVLKGKGSTWKTDSQNTFRLSEYHGSDLLQFHAPIGELTKNELYREYHMTNIDTYYLSLNTDGNAYSSDTNSKDFSTVSLRLMYFNDTEVILYIYAEAPSETIEVLLCAER